MEQHSRLERLEKAGVSKKQLVKAKNEYPSPPPTIYVGSENMTHIGKVLIPVDKIKALSGRCDESMSWLDNFLYNSNYRQDSEHRGFRFLLDSLEKKGLQNFIASFQTDQDDKDEKDDPIEVIYYEDLDVYVVEEGKHRATFAKVIGMKSLMAKVLMIKAPEEVDKFLKYKEKRKAIEGIIENLGLTFELQQSFLGLKKSERLILKYNDITIGFLDIFTHYWNDNGTIEQYLRMMTKLEESIKKLRKKHLLPINLRLRWLLFKNNNNPLTNDFLKKLFEIGYFEK